MSANKKTVETYIDGFNKSDHAQILSCLTDDTDAARNTAAEQELRGLVAERVAAVHTRDAATLAARPADDVITFDVLPPLNSRGSSAVAEHMRQWFDGYDGDIGYDVHQLHVSAEGDLGFCSFLYNVKGTLKTGDVVDMWVRATLCWRRIDGTWRIVHDHESVPFDPATGRAEISLRPQYTEG